MLTAAEAAALEASLDPRIGPEYVPSDVSLAAHEAWELAPFTTERRIDWAARTISQGEILEAFAVHCRDDLGDVEVLEARPALLVARWKREIARLELRAGLLGCERLATSGQPTLLLADLDATDLDALADRFAADAGLRSWLALYDLGRLEKLGAVRSSVLVYFEWFLRDEYGVKLLSSAAFTQGLINRGIISLGFG
jgi:hypothetical protein